jgi:triacylglycerol lipase
MMTNLNPQITAELAIGVYALTKTDSIEIAISELNRKFGSALTFSEETMLKAKTGGPWFIKCQTAFGFTLLGKNQLKGHAFFIFRGTQYLADWLTNLNVTASRSSSGQPVHDGFNISFKTMLPKLTEFMSVVSKSNITHIHCIGHSLGGALATLCGDWIQNAHKRKAYIYTYGSPRVGLYGFSSLVTKNIGAERIFRAYHKTDIVPCIPIWPYVHTPLSGQDYYLQSPGLIPMAEYHGMDYYVESVGKFKSWSAIAALQPEQKTDVSVLQWLKSTSPAAITITTLVWLNQAMVYVLKKCMNGAAWLISASFTTSFTLMDQLAYVLNKGIDLSEAMSTITLDLIRKIMSLLGMQKVLKVADLTRDFIRHILLSLQRKVNEFTQAVLSKVLVGGRAI